MRIDEDTRAQNNLRYLRAPQGASVRKGTVLASCGIPSRDHFHPWYVRTYTRKSDYIILYYNNKKGALRHERKKRKIV